jgi:hypothetical protein
LKRRLLTRQGEDDNGETSFVRIEPGYRKRNAIDGDGTFLGNVGHEPPGRLYPHEHLVESCRQVHHSSLAVDMPLDDVSTEPPA